MSSRILINTPHIKNSGGIANFYQSLAPHFSDSVRYNYITFYPDKSPSALRQITLYLSFAIKLLLSKRPVFLANPSFNFKSVRRDWVYLLIARFLAKKSYVFWHGWSQPYFHQLQQKGAGKWLFKIIYGSCSTHFVLATDFKSQLKKLGIKSEIILATTCVDDNLIDNLPVDISITPRTEVKNILFLSRIEADKGIIETIRAFEKLEQHFPDMRLKIAGSGNCLEQAKDLAKHLKLKNVDFVGYVRGADKSRLLANSDVLLFPSYHGEGLPLTLLEAMRFGLVVATTMMGGIKDIYRPLMGPALEIKSVESIITGLTSIKENPAQVSTMSKHNLQYVKSHFLASSVAEKLEAKLEAKLKEYA